LHQIEASHRLRAYRSGTPRKANTIDRVKVVHCRTDEPVATDWAAALNGSNGFLVPRDDIAADTEAHPRGRLRFGRLAIEYGIRSY
jgi:hypothetical protein